MRVVEKLRDWSSRADGQPAAASAAKMRPRSAETGVLDETLSPSPVVTEPSSATDSATAVASDDQDVQHRNETFRTAAAAAVAEASAEPGATCSGLEATQTDASSHSAVGSNAAGLETRQPLVIDADAALVDGLRRLLVHHLRRNVDAEVVNLSASQAELLEHHLGRLASYAQKIVHTLAFATRFLSKQQDEGDEESVKDAGAVPLGETRAVHAAAPAASETPKPPKKSLKLNDDEILMLYRTAQAEAAIEADWRGIPSPIQLHDDHEGFVSRSSEPISATASRQEPFSDERTHDDAQGRSAYVRILSRAMQESGRSPRDVAAEVLKGPNKTVCCGRPSGPPVEAADAPVAPSLGEPAVRRGGRMSRA